LRVFWAALDLSGGFGLLGFLVGSDGQVTQLLELITASQTSTAVSWAALSPATCCVCWLMTAVPCGVVAAEQTASVPAAMQQFHTS